MAGELSLEEIDAIYANRPKKGRPLQRHKWAAAMVEKLNKAGANGLEPQELQARADLAPHQVASGARWLRENSHNGPPILYVPKQQRWFAASSWHLTRDGMRDVFAQRAASLVLSLEHLADQSLEEWPEASKEIKRLVKDASRVREDMEDLVTGLV